MLHKEKLVGIYQLIRSRDVQLIGRMSVDVMRRTVAEKSTSATISRLTRHDAIRVERVGDR